MPNTRAKSQAASALGSVYLVDASIYIFRAYFSMPDRWQAANGYSVNALYGYVLFWMKFLQAAEPEHVVAAYDESLGSCFRNELYPDYKMSRVLPDAELAFQLEACKGFTELMGIPSPASNRYEADDIIATLAARAQRSERPVIILTRDKDLGQLVQGPQDRWWDFSAERRWSSEDIRQHFGVRPEQLVDYLALVGDPVDDIPGVPGVGAKTAAALLNALDSLDVAIREPERVAGLPLRGAVKLATKIHQHREQIKLAKKLVMLHRQVPLARGMINKRWQAPSLPLVSSYLAEFGLEKALTNTLRRYPHWRS